MMSVAGASDDDVDPDDDLLVDGEGEPDEYKGNDPVGAPVYPEGYVRIRMGDLRRMVAESLACPRKRASRSRSGTIRVTRP